MKQTATRDKRPAAEASVGGAKSCTATALPRAETWAEANTETESDLNAASQTVIALRDDAVETSVIDIASARSESPGLGLFDPDVWLEDGQSEQSMSFRDLSPGADCKVDGAVELEERAASLALAVEAEVDAATAIVGVEGHLCPCSHSPLQPALSGQVRDPPPRTRTQYRRINTESNPAFC